MSKLPARVVTLDTPEPPGTSPRVAYLGPPGTFTHAAALGFFGDHASYVELPTIDDVFDAVRFGDTLFGVAPIENSTEGAVTRATDALISGGVMIRAERVVDIEHCLMSTARTMNEIERIYSHPQALSQCRAWLRSHVPHASLVQVSSTAAAVRDALADPRSAAIGSRVAARLHAVPIVCDDIHDDSDNATRFVLLADSDGLPTGDDKTTIVFAVHDARGALLRVLQVLDDHGINLTRIESRPSRRRAWDYVFVADLDGHRVDERIHDATAVMSTMCAMLRVAGSYPRHREPTTTHDAATDDQRPAARTSEDPASRAGANGRAFPSP